MKLKPKERAVSRQEAAGFRDFLVQIMWAHIASVIGHVGIDRRGIPAMSCLSHRW